MIQQPIHNLLKRCLVIGLLSTIFLMQSCRQETLLEENKIIENRQWRYADKAIFKVQVNNHQEPYNLFVNFRHTASYRYANLFVLIHQINPDKKRVTRRLEFTLAHPDGQWIGLGSGNIINYQAVVKKQFQFPANGIYYFEIEQNMRDNPLKEILDVGLTIAPFKAQ